MPRPLKVDQKEYGHQAANMQGVRGRVKTYVGSGHFFLQLLFCSGHDILYHPPPPKFLYEILGHLLLFSGIGGKSKTENSLEFQ
jgi:hypothetical protein